VLPDYLDGLASVKLGSDGAEAFKRAEASAKGIKLPPYNPNANVLLFFEFSPGPTKYATGEYAEELRFRVPPPTVRSAEFSVDGGSYPVAPTDDVFFQANTRGGRVMDHILGNKAVFKKTTDIVGTAAIIGGATTAIASGDRTAQQVGLGIALAGLVTKVISSATTPAADTRSWDNLPRFISFANLALPPGEHLVTVQFRDGSGAVISNLTKTLTVNVPADGKDKVVFVSDQSLTPQKI
jgi:hypothetical protein